MEVQSVHFWRSKPELLQNILFKIWHIYHDFLHYDNFIDLCWFLHIILSRFWKFWHWIFRCDYFHKSGCLFRVSEAYYLSAMAYIDRFSILKFLWLPWSVFQQIYFKVKIFWRFLSNSGQFSAKKWNPNLPIFSCFWRFLVVCILMKIRIWDFYDLHTFFARKLPWIAKKLPNFFDLIINLLENTSRKP